MSLGVRLIVLWVGLMTTLAYADALDAPGSKQITVRSEILRGEQSTLSGTGDTVADIHDKWLPALNANVQKGTDSDGFLLGWNVGYWLELDQISQMDEGMHQDDEYKRAILDLTLRYRAIKTLEKKLGVTDSQLGVLAGVSQKVMQRSFSILDASSKASPSNALIENELLKQGIDFPVDQPSN